MNKREELKKKIDDLLIEYLKEIEESDYQFENYEFKESFNEIVNKFILSK